MADNIQLPTDGTGKNVRTTEISAGVHLQHVAISDTGGALAGVSTTGSDNNLNVNLGASRSSAIPVTGTITALNGTVQMDVTDFGNATISVRGTYVAALAFEESDDGGTTWYPIVGGRSDGGGVEHITQTLTNTNRQWDFATPALTHIRVRASAFTSGTISVRIGAGPFLYEPTPSIATMGYMGEPFNAFYTLTTTTAAAAFVAPTTGTAWYITDVVLSNAGTANTLYTLGTGAVRVYLAAYGGGAVMNFRTPIKITAATTHVLSVASTSVYVSFNYYAGPA